MRLVLILFTCAFVAACQSTPRGDQDERFYSYVDGQGNLVTVEREGENGRDGGEQPDRSGEKAGESEKGDESGEEETASGGVNKDFTEVNPEQYQSPGQAEKRMQEQIDEDEKDRFISYRGPQGEIITRPLNLAAEREAAEERQAQRPPEFERLPESERYKESTSRVPADCCRHLIEDAPELKAEGKYTLRFGTSRTVRLDRERPARAMRLGPGVGALEIQSYIRKQGYLAPRLLMLDEEGMPVLKVNSLFTRHYPETWSRYGYMDGWVERSPDFAYVVFYLPYARVGEQGLELEPDAAEKAGEHRRALRGELALTGRVERRRSPEPEE